MTATEAQRWNGPDAQHWADNAARYDAMAAGYTEQLMTAAALQSTDRVLDIGCGTGQITRLAARRAHTGHVTGIDLSAPMLVVATELAAAEHLTNTTYIRADAQTHRLPAAEFDAAISRSGVMFFDGPLAAFTNIARALRPGGRLTFVCHANSTTSPLLALIEQLAPDTTVAEVEPGVDLFTDPQWVRNLLHDAGFHEIQVTPFDARATAGRDAADATEFLMAGSLRSLVRDLTPAVHEQICHAITEALRPLEGANGVVLPVTGLCYTAQIP